LARWVKEAARRRFGALRLSRNAESRDSFVGNFVGNFVDFGHCLDKVPDKVLDKDH
jgi:hypothetical protein